MHTITVYGIPSCDITRKTLAWYKKKNIEVTFHDFKSQGLQKEKIAGWAKALGWERLLNKKSTTWRSLAPEIQQKVTDEKAAILLMKEYTSLVKRPVIEINNQVIVGFNEKYFTTNKNKPNET